jgi:hypothetical protein
MPLDLAVLAGTIVSSFLLPYVKLGAKKIAETVTEKVSGKAADQVAGVTETLWERVKSVFKADNEEHVITDFKEVPDAAKPLLISKLEKKLEKDPALAQELSDLVNKPVAGGASTGAQIMNAHIAGIVDARHSNFSGASGVEIVGVKYGTVSSRPAKEEKAAEEEAE